MANKNEKTAARWQKYDALVNEAYRLIYAADHTYDRKQARALNRRAYDLLHQADAMFN